MLATSSKERIGYPTQKPEQLIEKIIVSACPQDGVVGDFFCGSGTTAAVAEKLGRQWITSDVSKEAVSVTTERIKNIYSKKSGIGLINTKPKYGFIVEEI